MDKIINKIAEELNVKNTQVENAVKLIDEGNTIPFIARYRKEATGGLSDEILRDLGERLTYLRNLETRKGEIIKSIDEQGKLTDELTIAIASAETLAEVEDLYRPFKQKKKTRATVAKAKGLEPLADIIIAQEEKKDINEIAQEFVNIDNLSDEDKNNKDKVVATAEDAIQGALDIIAENISDNAKYRKYIKKICYREGTIVTKSAKPDEKSNYEMYYEFAELVHKLPSHRILAINRGEAEDFLKVSIEKPTDKILYYIQKDIIKGKTQFTEMLTNTIEDAFTRLIEPSIDREIRSDLTEKAEEKAIKVFGQNAKQLLLGAPIKGKTVMGFDPAYRTGCKIAVIDETGKVLDIATVYPTAPQNDVEGAKKTLLDLINKDHIDMIAIGNGTASRESEMFVSDMIKEVKHDICYVIVSEAGASVYSASKLATEEYPDINVSIRGAISIARRLQDPLAELVKIDPKAIGVGQYQHDVNQKKLSESLTGVVEDSVNKVGVDVNTATPSLLSYVSGINNTIAKNIVKYRDENGKLKERKELLKVPKLGKVAYEQCAGFIRIPDGKNPLENTAVHPESYEQTEKLLELLGFKIEDLKNKTIAFGAIDSPQARLIPIEFLHQHGLEFGQDYVEKRFDVGVGLHGDHVGGELDAANALKDRQVAATWMLDFNFERWTKDGTLDPATVRVLAKTPSFDHCIFSGRVGLDETKFNAFTETLFKMDYNNPEHKEMMDLEGLKRWVAGRTKGFAQLQAANEYLKFF